VTKSVVRTLDCTQPVLKKLLCDVKRIIKFTTSDAGSPRSFAAKTTRWNSVFLLDAFTLGKWEECFTGQIKITKNALPKETLQADNSERRRGITEFSSDKTLRFPAVERRYKINVQNNITK